jgi:O-antigen/teichoic acid export membrane protein
MQKIINQLIPFVLLGIAMVAFALGLVLIAYLFVLGACVGLVLFVIMWIRHFFRPKVLLPSKKHRQGRTFDSDDWNRL